MSSRSTQGIENLGGWLNTVVGRVCLDMLTRWAGRCSSYSLAPAEVPETGEREVVEAFLAASRSGDFDRLPALADPYVCSEGRVQRA